MLAATLIAIFLIPVMYYVIERFAEKRRRRVQELAPSAATPAVAEI